MNREEWEQKHLDLVEERKLVQASLNGVWRKKLDGCPHLHKREDIGRCDARKMCPCVYETGDTCELFQEILEEWQSDPYQEYLEAGVMPGNLEK